MTLVLDLALTGLALVVLGWGFERYRSRFVKADLLIAVAISTGLLLFVTVPFVFDRVGEFLSIRSRFTTVSLLANVTLLAFVLYLITKIRETRNDVNDLARSLTVDQAPDVAHPDGGKDTINVVIPAYNEGETISEVIDSLPSTIGDYRVEPIVVSDGSEDDTVRRAGENGSIVVEHHINQGQGGALQTGFEIARQNGASIVVTMDGDGQHPAGDLRRLVEPIIDDEADFVMGSRYRGSDYSGNGVVRRAGIRTFTWLINVLTKSAITDCTNGFRAIRGSALQEMTLCEEQFSAPELIIEARKHDLRIREIPITVSERQAGETKKPQLSYAIGLTRTIFATWIR